jgi:hypothetical protein
LVLTLALLAGCSGSDSGASGSTSTIATSTTSADPCRAGYQAAASKLNSSARYFSQAAQNGRMNEQFVQFAADYLQAMKTFDATVVALPCDGAVKEDLTQLVASQAGLEPLVAQFAAGIQPPVAEFNAAAAKVAEAVSRVNAALGITK